jgi:glutamyl-tRNA synthetase
MKDGTLAALERALESLRDVEPWNAEALQVALDPLVIELGVKAGALYQPLRVAVTGGSVSPGIFDTLEVLGRDRSLERIAAAIARLKRGETGT